MANARKELEENIQEYLTGIVMVKHRLNAITAISRLPDELLSTIFVCIAQDYFRSYANHKGCHSYYDSNLYWIQVAHVCHAWREIALSTPRLWSFIPATRRSVADQLFVRSKEAPLSVAIHYIEHDDDRVPFLEEIFSGHTSRLTELCINCPFWNIYDLCEKLTEPANILHTLTLSDKNTRHGWRGPGRIPHLFNGHTPHLRNLEIHGLVIRWDNPLLCSTLTSLVITGTVAHCIRKIGEAMDTSEQFLSTLESMESLHTLGLTNAIPSSQSASNISSSSCAITFPCLRKLRLNTHRTALSYARFLGHLSLPTNVLPQIACDDSDTSILDLILATKAHLARSEPLRIVQLRRDSYSPGRGRIHLHGWSTNTVTFSNTFVIAEPPSFAFDVSISESVRPTTYRDLFQLSGAFSDIQTLVTETDEDWDWPGIFSGTPNLRELVVQHAGPRSMLVALSSMSTVAPLGEEKHAPAPLLPLLEVIKFRDVRLDGPDFDMEEEYFYQLVDFLIFRCNHDCPIQEVHITQCQNVLEDDVARLEELVPEVVWDRVEDVESMPNSDEEDEDEEDEEEYKDNEKDSPSEEDRNSDLDDDGF